MLDISLIPVDIADFANVETAPKSVFVLMTIADLAVTKPVDDPNATANLVITSTDGATIKTTPDRCYTMEQLYDPCRLLIAGDIVKIVQRNGRDFDSRLIKWRDCVGTVVASEDKDNPQLVPVKMHRDGTTVLTDPAYIRLLHPVKPELPYFIKEDEESLVVCFNKDGIQADCSLEPTVEVVKVTFADSEGKTDVTREAVYATIRQCVDTLNKTAAHKLTKDEEKKCCPTCASYKNCMYNGAWEFADDTSEPTSCNRWTPKQHN
jgi:hypothetical protein